MKDGTISLSNNKMIIYLFIYFKNNNNNNMLFPTCDGNNLLKKNIETILKDLPKDHPSGMLLTRERKP